MAGPGLRLPSVTHAVASLCLAVLLAVPCGAQDIHLTPRKKKPVEPAAEKERLSLHIAPLRVNVGLVLVPVTVTDAMNRPVMGLKQDDFTVSEGTKPAEIRYFSAQDSPLSVGVLLDVSASMKDKIDMARTALVDFFNDALPEDDYFVITFADEPRLIADVTQSLGTIRAELAPVQAKGHTALLDAIYLGIHKLHHARYQRKALLIISDGGDNHSRFTASEIKDMVMESDVQIYGIAIYNSFFHTPEEWAGRRLLTQLTEATGGRTLTVGNASQIPPAAAEISTELRNQYLLGYAPTDPDDSGWRKIRVTVHRKIDNLPVQLNWRRGYMAPGQ